jgi:hypothetical protein
MLSDLPKVEWIKSMLQRLYIFFAHSPKRHLEYVKLAKVIETKELKILKNIRTLLVKMSQDAETMPTAKACFNDFIDIQIVLGLACIMPMLRTMYNLMQYAQKNDVLICYFLNAIKICQTNLNAMYVNPDIVYVQEIFWDFIVPVNSKHDAIPTKWVMNDLDLNVEGVECFSFEP